jgi:pimeloyl-ACP methyl ester carboxylesterase
MSKTILLIHGAFMTPRCWDPFNRYFTEKGYRCLAPAWPAHEGTVEDLRANPDPKLQNLGLAEIVDHHAQIIQGMPEPPILIGHSFGGLITQILLDRGLGQAGVALDPAPTRGIFAARYPTATRSLIRIIATPRVWRKSVILSPREFNYAFIHTLPPAEQQRTYQEYVVPETGRIFFQDATAMFDAKSPTRVDFNNGQRGPLLIIAGAKDRIVPAAMVKANFRLYNQRSGAITELQEFPERTHWLIAQPGWEEIAQSIDQWIQQRLPEVAGG